MRRAHHQLAIMSPFDSVEDYEINSHDDDVLSFIGGYVTHSISRRLKCTMCNNQFMFK